MPNLFSGINLAMRALLSQQQAIQVIEHNVANANTPGYRRQEAVLAASTPHPTPGINTGSARGQMGTGVQVDHIRRFNLEFYDGRYRQELSESKRWELKSSVLKQVEASLSELSSDGLIPRLDAFWTGWQAVSSDPRNLALRDDLRERSEALAQAFNQRATSLQALRKEQDLAIQQRVEEVNALAGQVARLNAQIANVKAAGGQPNDHLDERDRLLDRLAELSGAASNLQANGEVLVSIGGHALVVGSRAFSLTASDTDGDGLNEVSWVEDGGKLNLSRGELAGLFQARDETIPEYLSGLNALAYGLVTRVNELHEASYGLDGSQGLFFARLSTDDLDPLTDDFDPDVNYALEIRIDPRIKDPTKIAAAAEDTYPGDGSQAGKIAELQYESLMSGNTTTLNQYYTGLLGRLGLDTKEAFTKSGEHKLVADSLAMLAESVGGVSLDEEAANLVKSQRAFEAAARMLTALDDMLDRIINGMGVVGR